MEPAIHSAKEIKDILPPAGMKYELDDIAEVIDRRNGSGVLFILDGWDELPQHVPGRENISEIIRRNELIESDLVITSRQTSSASLYSQHGSRHKPIQRAAGHIRSERERLSQCGEKVDGRNAYRRRTRSAAR